MNIGIVGKRGSGKTTWAYRVAGLDPPACPLGTATLNYLACTIDGAPVLVWDFAAGIDEHSRSVLGKLQWIAVCYNGRSVDGIIRALRSITDAKIMILVTRQYSWSFLHLTVGSGRMPVVCHCVSDVWNALAS